MIVTACRRMQPLFIMIIYWLIAAKLLLYWYTTLFIYWMLTNCFFIDILLRLYIESCQTASLLVYYFVYKVNAAKLLLYWYTTLFIYWILPNCFFIVILLCLYIECCQTASLLVYYYVYILNPPNCFFIGILLCPAVYHTTFGKQYILATVSVLLEVEYFNLVSTAMPMDSLKDHHTWNIISVLHSSSLQLAWTCNWPRRW